MFEYHSFEIRVFFERTEFERTYETCLYSHKRFFSFETNFERTTDEFRKNVIWSNDLSRLSITLAWRNFIFKHFKFRFCSTVRTLSYQNKDILNRSKSWPLFAKNVLSFTIISCCYFSRVNGSQTKIQEILNRLKQLIE